MSKSTLPAGQYRCPKHTGHPGPDTITTYIPSVGLACNGVGMEFARDLNAAELKEIAEDEARIKREVARAEAAARVEDV